MQLSLFALMLSCCVTMPTQTYEKCIDGDCQNGSGVKQMLNGVYVGEFREGLPEGKGAVTYWVGHKFIGNFKKGRIQGQGTFVYSDGKVKSGKFTQFNHRFTTWYYGSADEEP